LVSLFTKFFTGGVAYDGSEVSDSINSFKSIIYISSITDIAFHKFKVGVKHHIIQGIAAKFQ